MDRLDRGLGSFHLGGGVGLGDGAEGLIFLTDQDGKGEGKDEKQRSEIYRAALEDVGGASAEDLVCHAAAECCTEAFLFRALHQDDQGHQQADDHEDH